MGNQCRCRQLCKYPYAARAELRCHLPIHGLLGRGGGGGGGRGHRSSVGQWRSRLSAESRTKTWGVPNFFIQNCKYSFSLRIVGSRVMQKLKTFFLPPCVIKLSEKYLMTVCACVSLPPSFYSGGSAAVAGLKATSNLGFPETRGGFEKMIEIEKMHLYYFSPFPQLID